MTENEALKTHLMEAFREKTYWTKIS
jgi:hypothetical protein